MTGQELVEGFMMEGVNVRAVNRAVVLDALAETLRDHDVVALVAAGAFSRGLDYRTAETLAVKITEGFAEGLYDDPHVASDEWGAAAAGFRVSWADR